MKHAIWWLLPLFMLIVFMYYLATSPTFNSKLETKEFEISMQKITGDWIIETRELPKDAKLFIDVMSKSGIYYLAYKSKSNHCQSCIIRYAIIDFEIINP